MRHLRPTGFGWLLSLCVSVLLLGLPSVVAAQTAAPAAPKDAAQNAAYEAAQWANLSITSQALALAQARQSAKSPKVREYIDNLIQARQRYETYEAQASAVISAKSEAGKQKYKTLNAMALAAYDDVNRYREALAQEDPDFDGLVSPFPISIADTQALLAPDEALILLHTTTEATYIFCVRHDRFGWYKTDLSYEALRQTVDDLRLGLDPTGELVRGADDKEAGEKEMDQSLQSLDHALTFSRAKAYWLYTKTIAPAEPMLKGAKLVYISASGPLSYLPMAVLVTQKPQGADTDARALRKTPWLIKSYALATLPSVNSLKFLRTRKTANVALNTDENAYLGIGAPELTFSDKTKDFEPLPGTALELSDISKLFKRKTLEKAQTPLAPQPQIITGHEATKANLFGRDLSRVRILVFATHAVKADEIEGLSEPALILTASRTSATAANAWGQDDGILTATQAANLRLNADWVILSACNTAYGRNRLGFSQDEMLSGLARGFFAAGAKSLIVSHWRVNDANASKLTVSAVRYYLGSETQKPLGRAQAMRQAMLDMLGDTHSDELSQPANWAAMVVVGEGL